MNLSIRNLLNAESIASIATQGQNAVVQGARTQQSPDHLARIVTMEVPEILGSSYHQAINDIKMQSHIFSESILYLLEESQQQIKKLENQTINKRVSAVRGGYALVTESEGEADLKTKIEEIKNSTKEHYTQAYLDYRKKTLVHEQTVLNHVIDHQSTGETNQHLKDTIKQDITVSFEKANQLLQDSKELTDKQKIERLNQIDRELVSACAQHADVFIDYAKNSIEQSLTKIKALQDQDQEIAREIGNLQLGKKQTDFLLNEAQLEQAAYRSAQQSASELMKKVAEFEARITSIDRVFVIFTQSSPQEQDLAQKKDCLNALKQELETIVHYFEQLAYAYTLPIRTIPKLEESSFLPVDNPQVSYNSTIILSKLNNIQNANECFCGKNGRIFLSKSVEGELSENPTKEYHDGINLVRLAIMQDYGINVLKKFDNYFFGKINTGTSLSTKELRDFINDQLNNNDQLPSYLLSDPLDEQTLTKLLTIETVDKYSNQKILKYESCNYNPFSSSSSLVEAESNDQAAIQRGKEIIASALAKHLDKLELTADQINSIGIHFKHEFSDLIQKPLTIGSLKAFLQKEFNACNRIDLTSFLIHPIVLSGAWGTVTALYASLKLWLLVNRGFLPTIGLAIIHGILHDQTMFYRMSQAPVDVSATRMGAR